MIGGTLLNLLNNTLQPDILQVGESGFFIIAQTLIGFSSLGFIILLAIVGLLPTLYQIQTGPMPEITRTIALMNNYPFRILSKFNEKSTVYLLSFCSILLIFSGILGFFSFIYHNIVFLCVGCTFSIISLIAMILFILFLLKDLWRHSTYYKKNKIDVIIEYIKTNEQK